MKRSTKQNLPLLYTALSAIVKWTETEVKGSRLGIVTQEARLLDESMPRLSTIPNMTDT